jgi:hypothetical protein
MAGKIIARASSMAPSGANGAAAPTSETVEGSAGVETPEKPKRKRRSPAAKGSAADKSRKKAAKPPTVTEADLQLVGEVVQIAYNDGVDPIDASDLIEAWRARIAAWDKIHGKVG